MTPEQRHQLNDAVVQLGYVRRALRRMQEHLERPTWEGLASARKDAAEYGAQLDSAIQALEALARGDGAR